jgi:hypothetical protein
MTGPAPVIRAELSGSNTATAEGITVRAITPVLQLCRRLVEAGYDPVRPLHAYRGDILCLKVRSIGEAAGLQPSGEGGGFRPADKPGRAPPVEFSGEADTDPPEPTP